MNSSHPSCLAAALLLTLGMAAPAVTSPVVVSLDHNRNRLLETLAQIKGSSDRCTYWNTFTNVERGIFLTHTDMLGARTCLENSSIYSNSLDKSGNCTSTVPCNCVLGSDMALDHVIKLWTVNGNDPTCSCTEGTNGYTCCNGGIEWHRTFSGADNLLISYFRNYAAGLPEWGRSTDFAGPHSPFTQESETVRGSPRGQTNFWADNSQASVLTRNGVVGVYDPQIVEMDQDYNIIHDSNPEGAYSGKYGRALYKRNWHWGQYTYTDRGDKAPTDYRGNGEPSAIPELDNTNYGIPPDLVWSPDLRRRPYQRERRREQRDRLERRHSPRRPDLDPRHGLRDVRSGRVRPDALDHRGVDAFFRVGRRNRRRPAHDDGDRRGVRLRDGGHGSDEVAGGHDQSIIALVLAVLAKLGE